MIYKKRFYLFIDLDEFCFYYLRFGVDVFGSRFPILCRLFNFVVLGKDDERYFLSLSKLKSV
jgi:hypothetical protein